jgi:hypothetical protein
MHRSTPVHHGIAPDAVGHVGDVDAKVWHSGRYSVEEQSLTPYYTSLHGLTGVGSQADPICKGFKGGAPILGPNSGVSAC